MMALYFGKSDYDTLSLADKGHGQIHYLTFALYFPENFNWF